MTDRASIYQQVTDQLIQQLEAGVAPWRKPWASIAGGMPANAASRRPYRGVNVLLLWSAAQAHGFDSSLWGTFNQWKTLGGNVKRGEKGTKIVFWRVVEKKVADPQSGDEIDERRFFARQYTVFNLDQCSGTSIDRLRPVVSDREFSDFGPAEKAITATGADIRHGGGSAFYRPCGDFIQLPTKTSFSTEAAYYSTALHEVVHWTGHESRLARLGKTIRFGDDSYAAEELVAELGASFLTAALGVPNVPIQDNASYLKNWLNVLRADCRAIFTASSAATKAADYILSFSQPVEADEYEEEPAAA